jgi:molybdopterin-guanine dinucleotide biosynthesis protein A
MRKGAIILCGGKSSRMGRDKAMLPFGDEAMLQRVVRLVSENVAIENVVVAAAAGQVLPPLPPRLMVARDQHEDRGPLEGLATGLRALADRVDAAFVTSCDVPLLEPALVDRLFGLLGDFDAVVPVGLDHQHVLSAVYRPRVLKAIEERLATGRLRVRSLLEWIRPREIPVEQLRDVDPRLQSLENINRADEYRAALAACGLDRGV